jgi:hypothetical protein
MMGERTVMQEALFYSFSLERHVPSDHMLRKIDRFIDLSGVRALLVALLQRRGSTLNRSGVDDPYAAGGLLLRHPTLAVTASFGQRRGELPLFE